MKPGKASASKFTISSKPEMITHACWKCAATGRIFVSLSPLRYKPCPICYGRGGRTERKG